MSTADPGSRLAVAQGRLGRLSLDFRDRDGMRWWTWLSLGGLGAAVALALAGGFPFDLPMPTHAFGWVEPTCGLTRGSTAIARGDLALAWRYNPASFAVIAFGVAGAARLAAATTTGRWLHVSARPSTLGWGILASVVIVLWAIQQSNAEFIISQRA